MNSNQLPKDVYQTPSSQSGEAFGIGVRKKESYALEHEAVLRVFRSEVDDELAIAPIEISPVQLIRSEMLSIGRFITKHRAEKRAASLGRSNPIRRLFRSMVPVLAPLIYNGSSKPADVEAEKSINTEGIVGGKTFPKPEGVTNIQFFYLREHNPATNQEIDIWHYSQESLDRMKHFTNSYKVTESYIEKSSTFYDERIADIVNRSSIPSELEVHNLLIAAKKYYTAVTDEEYIRSAAPRFPSEPKSDYDLAA